MARGDLNQVSVKGFEAPSIAELGDRIQTELIDPNVDQADTVIEIMQQFFFNPVKEVSDNYGALVYYAIKTRPGTAPALKTDENVGRDKPAKKRK